MDKRYDEIMNRIQVTDEMRERILSNLQAFDLKNIPLAKDRHFYLSKKWLSIAAGFAVLITTMFIIPELGALVLPYYGKQESYSDEENREVSSLSELSSAVNFEVSDIEHLPFVPEERFYDVVEKDTAQITYLGNGKYAVFRKSAGDEDNSGDFTEYSKIREIDVGMLRATLKGDSASFPLAVWSAGDFSYSLQISDGLSAAEWKALIEEIAAEKP